MQPEWAGFHSLDDHRGGPPAATTADHVATSLEMLGCLATITDAVTTLPLTDARLIEQVLPRVRALPLADAAPVSISLVWAKERAPPAPAGAARLRRRGAAGAGRGALGASS